MARYQIEQEPGGLSIQIDEVEGRKDALLDAFNECASGRCTCPTDEYQKLAELNVVASGDGITLRLRSKPGERFLAEEIATCLEHTTLEAADPSGGGADRPHRT